MKYNDVTHVRGRYSKENKFKNKARVWKRKRGEWELWKKNKCELNRIQEGRRVHYVS